MTIGPRSQCHACRHFRGRRSFDAPLTCDAFPSGIPLAVLSNDLDHREPVEGDNGIRFSAKPGDEYPEYALQRPTP